MFMLLLAGNNDNSFRLLRFDFDWISFRVTSFARFVSLGSVVSLGSRLRFVGSGASLKLCNMCSNVCLVI